MSNRPQHQSVISARRIKLQGQVQGVGFRPFVYRSAIKHQLTGWVKNGPGTVEILAQGLDAQLTAFENSLLKEAPAIAKPQIQSSENSAVETLHSFSILQSSEQGHTIISVPVDLFTCDDCLAELNDINDRRYRYPFINCTQCGPRYTLIRELPYDRVNTSMSSFKLCQACQNEYEQPLDRRFHAEPVACPVCGPTLTFKINNKDNNNNKIIGNEAALHAAVESLRAGKIIAVKGIGGYHLMCDASSDTSIARLRKNKSRPHKPLAVLMPSPVGNPFYFAEQHVILSDEDKKCLLSPARPILLSKNLTSSSLSSLLAPGLNEIGIMLPYSPLHHLLLNDFARPLVATSANLSGEPVLTLNDDVESRLSHVVDAYLHHDRLIERPADDAVFRNINNITRPLRIGRGFAPCEFKLPFKLDQPVLAVGAHMKNTITLAWGDRAIISPHIGEMDNPHSADVFSLTIEDLQSLYGVRVKTIVHDAHPCYSTTRWSRKQGLPVRKIFHHHAHASACYYEALDSELSISSDMLAFTWDGVGYGEDGTLWGGEALMGKPGDWHRVASLNPFYLPGGERAGREPWRSAAALCWQSDIDCPVLPKNAELAFHAWQKKLNCPQTTSVGRLFDAAAALTGICEQASFEGQGPMLLEAACENTSFGDRTHFIDMKIIQKQSIYYADWNNLLVMLLDSRIKPSVRALYFHTSLAQYILQQAILMREQHGIDHIGLCGGVFQNRVLTELATQLLNNEGFHVHIPERIPMNDAGISFGQIIEHYYTTLK